MSNYIQHNFNPTTTTYRGSNHGSSYPSSSYNYSSSSALSDNIDNDKAKGMKPSIAIQALNANVLIWAGFLAASLLVYSLLSGGDFSFLMTMGGLARCFGFGILVYKILKSHSVKGVSVKTLQLYSMVFIFRLISIMMHEGYLPYDKSGDWLYHFIEGTSLCLCGVALFAAMVGPFKHTYQANLDTFGAVIMAGSILFVSVCIHPNLNKDFISDTAWTFAMYLESAALLPQLLMFQKQKSGVVELLTAHFVFALGVGRVLEFTFWLYSHSELEDASGSKLPGYLALFSQILQILMMTNFFRGYYMSMKNSTPMKLPTTNEGMIMV
mmetsp:Transcript_38317/g.43185  ORF Transcript_38317/g.43185 Transcript_38317/m.43185 type:complete len:325 (+) Transcript_38317:49-1023(+)